MGRARVHQTEKAERLLPAGRGRPAAGEWAPGRQGGRRLGLLKAGLSSADSQDDRRRAGGEEVASLPASLPQKLKLDFPSPQPFWEPVIFRKLPRGSWPSPAVQSPAKALVLLTLGHGSSPPPLTPVPGRSSFCKGCRLTWSPYTQPVTHPCPLTSQPWRKGAGTEAKGRRVPGRLAEGLGTGSGHGIREGEK